MKNIRNRISSILTYMWRMVVSTVFFLSWGVLEISVSSISTQIFQDSTSALNLPREKAVVVNTGYDQPLYGMLVQSDGVSSDWYRISKLCPLHRWLHNSGLQFHMGHSEQPIFYMYHVKTILWGGVIQGVTVQSGYL